MKTIPEPTQRRLIQLKQLLSQQTSEKITSKDLENLTGWSSSLIRRDISFLNYRKGVSNGYSVKELQQVICSCFKIESENTKIENCCIVGLGRLGTAILEDDFLGQNRFKIVAGFDSNVNRIEILKTSFPLYPLSHLSKVVSKMNIKFAVLTARDEEIQKIVRELVSAKISGIVNYSKEVLSVPSDIIVENISPIIALMNISASVVNKNKE